MSVTEKPWPTGEEMKAAWDNHPNPSYTKVTEAMQAEGFDISRSRLERCKKAGWVVKERKKAHVYTPEAKQRLETVTDAELKTELEDIDDFRALNDAMMKDAEWTEGKLAEHDRRQRLVTSILMNRAIARRAMKTATFHPEAAAKQVEAVVKTLTVSIVVPPAPAAEQPRPIEGRVIEHQAEETPFQKTLREFRAKQVLELAK